VRSRRVEQYTRKDYKVLHLTSSHQPSSTFIAFNARQATRQTPTYQQRSLSQTLLALNQKPPTSLNLPAPGSRLTKHRNGEDEVVCPALASTASFFCSDRVHGGDKRTKKLVLSQPMMLVAPEATRQGAIRQASRYRAFSACVRGTRYCTSLSVSSSLAPLEDLLGDKSGASKHSLLIV
jgi:hypothetical protein